MTTTQATDLSFEEAMVALRQGHKIKLPEWTGYWFLSQAEADYGQIRVLTRTGDILGTPHFSRYDHRTDWQITDGSLGFDFAILALKAGKLVRRRGWNGKGMFIFMHPGDVLRSDFLPNVKSLPQSVKDYFGQNPTEEAYGISFTPYLCMKAADGSIVNGWLASQTDMLAEDWEVAG